MLLIKFIRILLGCFTGLMCLTGFILSFTERPVAPFIIITVIFGCLTYLLFKPKKKQQASLIPETISLTEQNEPPIEYVETGNMVYRADGQPISDEEVPYLIQVGYEKALEKEKSLQRRRTASRKWQAVEYSRLINDSYRILSETADPETFCNRFNFIKSKIDELNDFQLVGDLENSFPIDGYNALVSEKNVKALLFKCYQKYYNKAQKELKTKKGIENRKTKFWDIVQKNLDIETLRRLNN